ncbi:hypothetical protein BCD67_05585 [Oscillatoriales cyanobacterium USR001]|nr:hypothetical protein BCD67_05585 [Oscillatoriales cyanobacterium USR001]
MTRGLRNLSLSLAVFLALLSLNARTVLAFCGFFVAKVDAKLFNNRSEVAIAYQNNNTTYNLAFDYKGDPKEFALVLPVPIVLKKQDVKVIDPKLFQRLDDFTAPRLVRYQDNFNQNLPRTPSRSEAETKRDRAPVTVVERFSVGEYDVVILSANESNALASWLRQNDYRLPDNAARYLKPYIDQKLFFFVVRINVKEQQRLGFQNLRPIQFTVKNSQRVMLPFQLGKINSEGTQDIIVYFLSDKGRAESSNYTNVMIPSNFAIPQEIESKFGEFYKGLLATTIKAVGRETVVTEYAWDTGSCDPCSASPLTFQELKELGMNNERAFITRLHLQYTKDTYNRDLEFRVTSDTRTYQGRYILTPSAALSVNSGGNKAQVQAPYGKQLSTFQLEPLFKKYQ